MKKYKINFNRPPMDPENSKNQPDFDKFISGYQPKSGFPRLGKIAAAILGAAGVIAGLAYFGMNTNTPAEKTEPFINPPIKGADIAYTYYSIEPSKDTTVRYENGSVITIPANAFLDDLGEPVKEAVELRYREFHDVADFLLSGIPMTYDSAGEQSHFESAGMLEILAFSKGAPVFVNPAAQIKVSLVSDNPGNRFNIYYMDTVKKNWTFLSRDTSSSPALANTPYTTVIKKAEPVAALPEPPKKPDPKGHGFDIAFDKKEFPELSVFEKVSFEVSEDEQNFDPQLALKTWENVSIEKSPDLKNYLVTFSSGNESHVFKARPVFEGGDYEKAKKLYDANLARYNLSLAKRKNQEQSQQKKLDSLFGGQFNEVTSSNRVGIKMSIADSIRYAQESMVERSFLISQFGIYNSDCPLKLPKGLMVKAQFLDEKKKLLEFDHVYLVEKGKKAMYSYYPDRYNQFQFNPASQNMLMGITKDNKLAIFSVEDFKKLKLKGDSAKFGMTVIMQPIKTPKDLRALLKI